MQGQVDNTEMPVNWRFGAFELYPEQRRLLRDNLPVNLEERAFDLLVLLARNDQRELDRREVTEAIWGKRPVSDATLRQLVFKARRAVDDDGERQAVIRTLHGRSLKWVAALEELEQPAVAPVALVPAQPGRSKRHRVRWLAAAAIVVAAVVGAGVWIHSGNASLPPDQRLRLVIAPFANQSGDKAMDWTADGLPGLLASLLGRTGNLDVVDPIESARLWRYQPQQGRSREAQLRFGSGANVLIGGNLRKLTDTVYELDLALITADGTTEKIAITGQKPSVLAVDAVPRIRRALRLDKAKLPDKLPHDAFLAEAYARGMDLAADGQWDEAREYFRLCVKSAPAFLPAAIGLGTAQARTNDIAGSEKTLESVVARAGRSSDIDIRARAQLLLGHLARSFDENPKAAVHLQLAVTDAQRVRDVNTEIEARALLADVLHKLQQPDASRQQLLAAQAMAKAHPGLLVAHGLIYDTVGSIAGDEGDFAAALKSAQDRLDLDAELGDERAVVASMFNVANDLRGLHRDAESLTMSASCYQRAVAGDYLGLQFACAANFAASLLTSGLSESAIGVSGTLAAIAKRLGSPEYQVLALQLRSLGEMQQGDYLAALADLRKGDALTDVGKLDFATFLDQEVYEAAATFEAAPKDMLALSQRFDARAAGHMQDAGYAHRRAMLRALAAAAEQRPHAALENLRVAAGTKPLPQDSSVETRMPALLIALANRDKSAADFALNGYDPATTNDASLLPLYIKWTTQQGDSAGAEHARARLAALRKQGTDALIAAALDPRDPLGRSPMASAMSGINSGG